MAFRVGQKVVCINAVFSSESNWTGWQVPKLNGIYTIRAFSHGCSTQVGDKIGILLEEICNEFQAAAIFCDQEPAFGQFRFRPVADRKTDISIFTAMLNPSKEHVRS